VGLTVDLGRRVVTIDDREVKLTRKEYDLLRVLVIHASKMVTHQHLLREVWGPRAVHATPYLRVYMGQLRTAYEGLAPPEIRHCPVASRQQSSGFV